MYFKEKSGINYILYIMEYLCMCVCMYLFIHNMFQFREDRVCRKNGLRLLNSKLFQNVNNMFHGRSVIIKHEL